MKKGRAETLPSFVNKSREKNSCFEFKENVFIGKTNNFLKDLQLNEKCFLLSKILSDKYLPFSSRHLTPVAVLCCLLFSRDRASPPPSLPMLRTSASATDAALMGLPSPFADGLEHKSQVHPKATHHFFSQTSPKNISVGSPVMKVKGWRYPPLLVYLCHLRFESRSVCEARRMHISSMSRQACAGVLGISGGTRGLLLSSFCGDQPLC